MLENTFREENFILNLGQVDNFMSQKDFKSWILELQAL